MRRRRQQPRRRPSARIVAGLLAHERVRHELEPTAEDAAQPEAEVFDEGEIASVARDPSEQPLRRAAARSR